MAVLAARAQRIAPDFELPAPIAVYSDEPAPGAGPSASSPSEDRALGNLDQLVRLKKSDLHIDYDLLDVSQITSDGLHPSGGKSAWPNGPDTWIARCRAAQIHPGLRFGASALRPGGGGPVFFDDKLLVDFVAALQSWYDRGIRLFVFDGLDLSGLPSENAAGLTNDEIITRNAEALRTAFSSFRAKNRGAVLFVIQSPGTISDAPSNRPSGSIPSASDPNSGNQANRLGPFLLISTGPPHPPAMPQTNLQRATDIETDAQVSHLEQRGVSLAHIFSAGFNTAPAPAGVTSPGATSLPRGPHRGWKGAFLVSMARGGWVNTISGGLDSMQSADARWMARVQKLFFAMQAQGHMHSFGDPPTSGQPYGFAGATKRGVVYVVVNSGQAVATLPLPRLAPNQPAGYGRVQFRDAGFSPELNGNNLTLGPGQMAMVGFGVFATQEFNFGVEQDVVIPRSIEPVDANFHLAAPGVLEARIDPPIEGVLRIVVLEREPGSIAQAGAAGSVPAASRNNRFTLEMTQGGRPIPLRSGGSGRDGESILNAGLPWAVAEIDVNDLTPGIPLRVRFRCNEKPAVTLEGSAYQVIY